MSRIPFDGHYADLPSAMDLLQHTLPQGDGMKNHYLYKVCWQLLVHNITLYDEP
jgi:hypothetical protein